MEKTDLFPGLIKILAISGLIIWIFFGTRTRTGRVRITIRADRDTGRITCAGTTGTIIRTDRDKRPILVDIVILLNFKDIRHGCAVRDTGRRPCNKTTGTTTGTDRATGRIKCAGTSTLLALVLPLFSTYT